MARHDNSTWTVAKKRKVSRLLVVDLKEEKSLCRTVNGRGIKRKKANKVRRPRRVERDKSQLVGLFLSFFYSIYFSFVVDERNYLERDCFQYRPNLLFHLFYVCIKNRLRRRHFLFPSSQHLRDLSIKGLLSNESQLSAVHVIHCYEVVKINRLLRRSGNYIVGHI